MKITIGHLYPDLLNLYGDRGNIQCLMRRCQWRGIEAETIPFELDDKIDFSKLDIVLLGGGSDREQMRSYRKSNRILRLMWKITALSLQSAVAISYLGSITKQIRET